METIYLEHPYQHIELHQSSVALGNFDGLHAGHQEVIHKAILLAKQHQLKAGVMTFYPHPKEVLGRIEKATYITPLDDKLRLLEEMGLDFVIVVKFTRDFASLSPEEFIKQYIEALQIKHVVTGFDFCFGFKGEGNVQTLIDWSSSRHTFEVHMLPLLDNKQQKISSSRIRELITEGQVEEAVQLLHHPFEMRGKVIHGEKRGRLLGFPTANLEVYDDYLLPKIGVYAVYVLWREALYPAVLNIGRKPTFHTDHPKPSFEVHVLDFNQNLYGEVLTLRFISYLREEKKFNSIEELKDQINQDIEQAKNKFFS